MNIEELMKVEQIGEIPVMVTLKEASERTGLSYYFLRDLCINGKIVHIKAGTKYLINLKKLVEYLNKGDQDERDDEKGGL